MCGARPGSAKTERIVLSRRVFQVFLHLILVFLKFRYINRDSLFKKTNLSTSLSRCRYEDRQSFGLLCLGNPKIGNHNISYSPRAMLLSFLCICTRMCTHANKHHILKSGGGQEHQGPRKAGLPGGPVCRPFETSGSPCTHMA